MTVNFNLKITSGKRTPLEIVCTPTSVNTKTLEFKNSSNTITDAVLAEWIVKALKTGLKDYSEVEEQKV